MERSSGKSDAELLMAVREGDLRAFEVLYDRYKDWVVSLAWRICGNREDSLDVLQETFLYLHRKAPTLELHVPMKGFLFPVVKHLALSHKETKRRMTHLGDNAPHAPEPAPPSEIEPLLKDLTDGQRDVVLMRFVDGMDLDSIARAMEIPLGTVKSRLHHALKTLRDRLPNR